jgi:hypothetical protein
VTSSRNVAASADTAAAHVQVLPGDSRFELTLGYDLSFVVYAIGDERMFFFPGAIDWEERTSLAHSFSVRVDFLVGNEAARQKRWGLLLGLLFDGGWSTDGSTWWLTTKISVGGRMRIRQTNK